MTDRDAIIAKIKKCLALAKSSNEHEAAAALRQAQKLMQAHGVSDLDIEHADVQEESVRAGAYLNPSRWESALAGDVGAAFGCRVVFVRDPMAREGKWMFVGVSPAGEIARYAFEVLFRQVKHARANHIKTVLKRCTTTRTRRADLFCEGWVIAATELVERFAVGEEQRVKIAGYLASRHNLSSFTPRDRNAGRALSERDYGDLEAGHRAGRDAQFNRGVAGGERLALE